MPAIGIACELRRVPCLSDQPLALAADNGIRAVSDLAAAGGIAPGMTITGARALCRSLVVLPHSQSVYEEAAEAVWDAIATESNVVEPVSDELCFALFDNSVSLERVECLALLLAGRMGIAVLVGIGSSKLVAEQAARRGDKEPVLRVQGGMEAVFLASVPLSEVTKVDPAVRMRLERLGVRTLGDILRLPSKSLDYQFRSVATLLQSLAVGNDYDRVKANWPRPAVEHEYAFDDDTDELPQLRSALDLCASRVALQLGKEHTYCRRVQLRVTFCDRTAQQVSERLCSATRDAGELLAASERLLRRMSVDRSVAGIHLEASGLGGGDAAQLSLLPDAKGEFERSRRLEEVMGFLRQKFGISAVVLASLLATARQIDLWTYPLSCRKRESVMVATNPLMEPIRFYRRKRNESKRYDVLELHDRWQETAWSWDRQLETSCYRVLTDPSGLHQLERLGIEWKLTATAD